MFILSTLTFSFQLMLSRCQMIWCMQCFRSACLLPFCVYCDLKCMGNLSLWLTVQKLGRAFNSRVRIHKISYDNLMMIVQQCLSEDKPTDQFIIWQLWCWINQYWTGVSASFKPNCTKWIEYNLASIFLKSYSFTCLPTNCRWNIFWANVSHISLK